MQSTMLGAAWFLVAVVMKIAGMVFALIPVLGWIVLAVLFLAYIALMIGFLIVWIITLVKSFSGLEWEIPIVGPLARQQLARMNF